MRLPSQEKTPEDLQTQLSRRGKGNRRRGQVGERELCALLSDAFGQVVKRKLGQARDSGHDIDLPPFRIEVKRRKRIANLYEWIMQARHPDKSDPFGWHGVPIVALRADGKDWLVVMQMHDFL